MELRVLRLQELVELGRLITKFIPGIDNIADAFTKDSDKAHVELSCAVIGLSFGVEEAVSVSFLSKASGFYSISVARHVVKRVRKWCALVHEGQADPGIRDD